MSDRAEIVHENFLTRVAADDFPARRSAVSLDQTGMSADDFVGLFNSQVVSRHLDRHARKLQARGEAFYTIGSSGHEGNAAIAAAFRVGDMAFLHYRDAAFQIERARQAGMTSMMEDMLLSFTASSDDPISGGRHKVLGSKSLFIPPQTSTIASHLPKAVGAAVSIGLAKRARPEHKQLADDALILCSFGDASLNHSTAQGAINTASWTAYRGLPVPIVFICEDNGIGISTKTPDGWVGESISARPALKYFYCDGLDVLETYKVAREVEAYVRATRKPAFLHMNTVRLYGHAGADVQTAYLSNAEVEANEANDPLLHSAAALVREGVLDSDEILDIYQSLDVAVSELAEQVITRPKLATSAQVMASLIPPLRQNMVANGPSQALREATFDSDLRMMEQPQHMARLINFALTDIMLEHREVVLAGEDIGPKGGVYGVTLKLYDRFGPGRVMNTILDEQSILGLAIGLAHNGFVPIPEIQFLAYLHNAEDQLRGEAATLPFFSDGQFTNPMVLRIAGLGYQKGFGGHFHNDNSLAVIRDIPGVILAVPSNGHDAVLMLREAVRLAREEQRVVVFLEPIALYSMRDLHEPKDGLMTFHYPQPRTAEIRIGDIGIEGEGTDIAIVTYGNGAYLARQAAKLLFDQHGICATIIDLRWLSPLNEKAVIEAAMICDSVLIVDECRITGSLSEGLMALFAEQGRAGISVSRLAADDSFIPLGRAATVTMPSRDDIVDACLNLTTHR
jgi:2-oxoisovalerate dehydrogenase E1 component